MSESILHLVLETFFLFVKLSIIGEKNILYFRIHSTLLPERVHPNERVGTFHKSQQEVQQEVLLSKFPGEHRKNKCKSSPSHSFISSDNVTFTDVTLNIISYHSVTQNYRPKCIRINMWFLSLHFCQSCCLTHQNGEFSGDEQIPSRKLMWFSTCCMSSCSYSVVHTGNTRWCENLHSFPSMLLESHGCKCERRHITHIALGSKGSEPQANNHTARKEIFSWNRTI